MIAILLENISWEYSESVYELDKDVRLCSISYKNMSLIHHELPINKYVSGDEDSYFSYILVENHDGICYGEQNSIDNRVLNILSIVFGTSLHCSRLVMLDEKFKPYFTHLQNLIGVQTDSVITDKPFEFNIITLTEIRSIYEHLKPIYNNYLTNIPNSLFYYFNSWNINYLGDTCINLSIALESLFSPNSSTELSHQISFNVSKLVGKSYEERKSIYKQIKKFYSIRSKIVHGEVIKDDDYNIISNSFFFISGVFKQILLDKDLISVFNDNKKRADLFEKWMFS